MDLALLVLRVVVGAFFMGHGAQKLFGAFGGHGLAGTAAFMESLGMKPGRLHASASGWAEFGGGLLLVLGLATPLGAALIIAVMVTAILTVHAKNGPWVTNSGYEYNVVLIAACVALAGVGPGDWSLDSAIDFDSTGTEWALGALAVGLLGGFAAIAMGRRGRAEARTTPAGSPGGRFARTEVGGATADRDPEIGVATAGRDQDPTLRR
jgi:putative oxidoreductase